LEETVQADLLLHVVDAGSPNRVEQIDEVNKVLKEIGADSIPQILVLNKIDVAALSAGAAGYGRDEYGRIAHVRLSAKTGQGLDVIKLALAEAVAGCDLHGYEHERRQEDSSADRRI
jgi:GTP-binding protein HflX